MDDSGQTMVKDMVLQFPQLRAIYDEHLQDMGGEIMPHVIFWNFMLLTVDAFTGTSGGGLDWRGVLDFLEDRYRERDPYVCQIIATSFVESLPGPSRPGHDIVKALGPELQEAFRQLRPGG